MIETIAILSACVVYLARQGHELYRSKSSNGAPKSDPRCAECYGMVRELHHWSRPMTDPATGQLHFPWYLGYKELRVDLELNRQVTRDLQASVDRLSTAITKQLESKTP